LGIVGFVVGDGADYHPQLIFNYQYSIFNYFVVFLRRKIII